MVASVFPLYEFAREVGGAQVEVWLLLPAGVEPHSWEPTPAEMVRLREADLFMYIGRAMEPWAEEVLRAVGGGEITVMEVMASADRGGGAGGGPSDPHIWLDLSQAAAIVERTGEVLAGLDPQRADLYRGNAARYAVRLRDLDRDYMAGLKACSTRILVTGGHAAFGHLARRYGLTQEPLYGLSPDAEPSPRQLVRVTRLVREEGVGAVFFEELLNPRLAQVLSEETGTKLMMLNPGANLTARQWSAGTTFLDLMRGNLASLREGLSCE
ncbi:MAG: zinc ABC transporter substrate-binding protein [bacterium]|nr:MAG: zinc ABC transporter substrate-binding protein [bacterium]